jgi:HK97 family phage major capsid protein
MRSRKAAEFEFECTNAAADKFAGEPQGVILPADVLRSWKRDLNSADDAAMFGDDYRGESFIDVLRNNSSVMQAGARTLSGLTGDVVIPKKTAASSAGWIATEGGAASESEFTVGTVSLTPKQIGAFTDMTRQLRQQSSMDVENMIRDDLGQAIALAIDLGGLEGTGADGQPTGLLNQASLTKVTAWAAANPTFAEVVTLETAVADANALMGNLSYICPTNMVGAMKTTEKASGTAQFLTDGKGLNGHRLVSSNQGTAGNMYFGNWNDLLLGFWSGLDLLVDPYSLSNTGSVRVNAFQTCDVAVRHVESFAYGNDTA